MSLLEREGEIVLESGSKALPLEVLYSDYENHSILWSCSHRWGLRKIEYLWTASHPSPKAHCKPF